MKKICKVVVVLFCLGILGIAQTPRHVAVHAGHVLDVKTGKLLADQTLVIEDGKIVSSGAAAEAKIPTDAVRIDLPNATVLPGLIDAHTHLTMEPKFGYREVGNLCAAGSAHWREECADHAAGRIYHGAQRRRQRLHRRRLARRDQRGRCAGAADAGERAGAEHYRRTLRQQYAALRISRHQRWRGGRHRRRATQGAREHQVRRGSD